MLTLGTVTTGIGVYMMPKYIRISRDFNASMSWMKLWNAVSDAAVVVIPLAGLLAIFACSQLLVTLFHPRYGLPGPLRRWTDWLLWHLPVVRTAVTGGLGDVCDLMGAAMESGMTLHSVLIEASEIRARAVLQRRLRKWAAGIESGLGTEAAAAPRSGDRRRIACARRRHARFAECIPISHPLLRLSIQQGGAAPGRSGDFRHLDCLWRRHVVCFAQCLSALDRDDETPDAKGTHGDAGPQTPCISFLPMR